MPKKGQLTSLGLLEGSNDFSEQMLDVSLSSEPSSKGLLTLRLRGELFCKKERNVFEYELKKCPSCIGD